MNDRFESMMKMAEAVQQLEHAEQAVAVQRVAVTALSAWSLDATEAGKRLDSLENSRKRWRAERDVLLDTLDAASLLAA
jgi:hypothetical protein